MLVLVAPASLFSTAELVLSDAKLRPFDAITLLVFLHLTVTRGLATRLPSGPVLCGLFFADHAAGTAILGPGNFLREAIQAGFVFGAHLYTSLMPGRADGSFPAPSNAADPATAGRKKGAAVLLHLLPGDQDAHRAQGHVRDLDSYFRRHGTASFAA